MQLSDEDFEAITSRMLIEVTVQCEQLLKEKHKNFKKLPPNMTMDVIKKATMHYLKRAYNEGLEHGKKLQHIDDDGYTPDKQTAGYLQVETVSPDKCIDNKS